MTNVQAPIATDKDRSAIAHLVGRIRPDLDAHGAASSLAKNPCQELDVLTLQAIIAAVTRPDQKTPAILGLDGDHTNRARAALSKPVSVTSKLPGYTPPEPECGYPGCGARHGPGHARRIPGDIRPHEWEQPRPITPASPEQIAHVRPSSFKRHEEQTA